MAEDFDPTQFGAVAVEEPPPFDPTQHGAIPVQQEAPQEPSGFEKVLGAAQQGLGYAQKGLQLAMNPGAEIHKLMFPEEAKLTEQPLISAPTLTSIVHGLQTPQRAILKGAFGDTGEHLSEASGRFLGEQLSGLTSPESLALLAVAPAIGKLGGIRPPPVPESLAEVAGIAKPDIAQPSEPVATDAVVATPIVPEAAQLPKNIDLTENPNLPPERPRLAVKLDDGTILHANDVALHSQLLDKSGIDPTRVIDSGTYGQLSGTFRSLTPESVDVFPQNASPVPAAESVVTAPLPPETSLGKVEPVAPDLPTGTGEAGWVGPLYHGSPDFKGEQFSPEYRGRETGLSRGGFNFTESKPTAEEFARGGVDPDQASVDIANQAMRDAAKLMDSGVKIEGYTESAELPEFNVRHIDDSEDFRSGLNELADRMPPGIASKLREAAQVGTTTANPAVIEAYVKNPKKVMVQGKPTWVTSNPEDIRITRIHRQEPSPVSEAPVSTTATPLTQTERSISGNKTPVAQTGAVGTGEASRPEPQVPSTFSVQMPTDAFGTEQTPVSSALMDMGGVTSKTTAKRVGRYEGNEALWDDVQNLSHPTHNTIYPSKSVPVLDEKGTPTGKYRTVGIEGEMPDVAAQTLHDAGLISDPSPTTMWQAIAKESKSSRDILKSQKSEIDTQKFKLQETSKQAQDFGKAQQEGWKGGEPVVPVKDLQIGDHVEVKGEKLKVVDIDPDSFDVTLEDGKKYGVQTVKDGTVIYGEHESNLPKPKLLAGENQGDLISSTQKEPFALVGEKGTDFASQQAALEKAQVERAQSEKGQTDLFKPTEGEPNATQKGQQQENVTIEHPGVPQGSDLPAHGEEVRQGQGERASGSGSNEPAAQEQVAPKEAPTAPISEQPNTIPTPAETQALNGGEDSVGIAERYREEQQPGSVIPGVGKTADEARAWGHDFINKGGNPYDVINNKGTKRELWQDVGVVRAEYERLSNEKRAAEAALESNPSDPQLKMAFDNAEEAQRQWSKDAQPVLTRAGDALRAASRSYPREINTFSDFTDIINDHFKGEVELTPEKRAELQKAVKAIRKGNVEATDSRAQVTDAAVKKANGKVMDFDTLKADLNTQMTKLMEDCVL